MPLTTLTGPFSALERALVDRLRAAPPGPGRPVTVVTASVQMRDRLERLLARESGLALLNIRFHTFFSLAREVCRGTPGPLVFENELFHEHVVAALLREGGMTAARAASLAAAARSSLRDLEEAGVDADQFEEHFAEMEPPAGREAALHRLLALHRDHGRRLRELGVETLAGLVRRAARRVEETPEVLPPGDLVYYGFYDLNGVQADFFSAVGRHAPVVLFFPCRPGHPADRFAERFLEVKLGFGGGRTVLPPAASPALGDIGHRLFNPAAPPAVRPPAALRVMNASGERDEAWRVAKEILRVREEIPGLAFEDIGVVARSLSPYRGFLPRVFEDNALPVSWTEAAPLAVDPSAPALHALARLCLDPFSTRDALEILTSPALRSDALGGPDREPLARFLERWGLGAGAERLRGLLRAAVPGADGAELVAALPPGLAEGFLRFLEGVAVGRDSWAGWVEGVQRLWDGLFDFPPAFGEAARSALWSLAALDRVGPPRDAADIRDAFRRALETAGVEPPVGRGVRVMDAMAARGDSFRVLFLMGLKEGAFPRTIREDPLLTDDLRRLLQDPGGHWILPKRDGYDEEKMIFALLVNAAREQLIVSYPRSREDGRTEVPSLYLRELCRAAHRPLEADGAVPRPPLARWRSVPADLLTPDEAAVLALAGVPTEKSLGSRAARLASREKIADWARPGAPGPWDGLAGEPAARLRRLRERGVSPTELDDLARCPFRYFAQRVLSLPEDRPLDPRELPRWLKGRLYHAVLERVGRAAAPDAWIDPARLDSLLTGALQAVFGSAGPLPRLFPPLLWGVWRETMTATLKTFLDRAREELAVSGYRPFRVETLREGPAAFDPGVRWRGRPDRVDRRDADGAVRAVDYKLRPGRRPLEDRVGAGEAHQPPAYLELLGAAEVRFDYVEAGEAETLRPGAVPADALHALQRGLWSRLTEGRFVIRPGEDACRYCPYPRACRKAHLPTRRRAERDR